VRGEQMEREQEQATHSIMLREIQRMLNDERTKNENLEGTVSSCPDLSKQRSIKTRGGKPFSVSVPQSAKSMTKFFRVPTNICDEGSEFWAPVAAWHGSVCSYVASKST